MTRSIIAYVAFIFTILSLNTASAQTELTEGRFRELMDSVVRAEQKNQIDWHPNLLCGQKDAIAKKKPMFIWSMDGHPLGCT